MIKVINESNSLSDFRGNSRAGNCTRVRIKATGKTGWVESTVDDRWGQGIRVVYDDRPGMWPDFFTVDEVEILEPTKKPKTESFGDDFEQYTYVKSKDVYDADGFRTEYTMYYNEVEDRYVFVFGDSDFYNPNDGYEEFDYECDTEREADEWFDNYEGFEDLDEGLINEVQEKPYAEVRVGMKWTDDEFFKQCNKIRGSKAWIETRWNSVDSDEEHREVTIYDVVKGENCDILVDPKYPNEWYGKIYVNSAINLDQFYPDYWNSVLESNNTPTSRQRHLPTKESTQSGKELICVKYKGDKYSLKELSDYALSLGDSIKNHISSGYLIICTDDVHIYYLNNVAKQLGLSTGVKVAESCKESIYTDNGFNSRKDYLNSLADDFGVDKNTVYDLASVLGPEEDFDALVTELEDMADDYEETDNGVTPFQKDLEYALHRYNYVVYDADVDEYNSGWISHFDDYKSAADDVAYYICNYYMNAVLCDTRKHLKITYDADKLDVNKLTIGEKGKLYADIKYFTDDPVHYIDDSVVGEDIATENIRDILDMCEVKTEKY